MVIVARAFIQYMHHIVQDEDGDMFWEDASALLDGGGGGSASRSAGPGSNEPSLDLQRWYGFFDGSCSQPRMRNFFQWLPTEVE